MSALAQPFNLDLLEDGERLTRVMEEYFGAAVTAISRIGQGFYAYVYQVTLDKDPKDVIVKCHKYAGISAREKIQLETLRKHALVSVPEVYALHDQSELLPCEALSMEVIPGIKASKVQFPDEGIKDRFVDSAIENLLAWHSVSNPAGFGELGGPYYGTWREYFGPRVAEYHKLVHSQERRGAVSVYVMSVIDRSFENLDHVLQELHPSSALVHSDYNVFNMMVDPVTFALTGIIDPIDAGWSDYEIDLFHLRNGRPELGLLERYLQEVPADEGFWLRLRFYWFWDDVKHYVRMGWYEEDHFRSFAEALELAMRDGLMI